MDSYLELSKINLEGQSFPFGSPTFETYEIKKTEGDFQEIPVDL